MIKKAEFVCTMHKDAQELCANVRRKGGYEYDPYIGGVYLHGELEREQNYDCVRLLNPEEFEIIPIKDSATGKVIDSIPVRYFNGVYPCYVHGATRPCIAFIWTVDFGPGEYNGHPVNHNFRNAGLIVYAEDTEAVIYASEMFNLKVSEL